MFYVVGESWILIQSLCEDQSRSEEDWHLLDCKEKCDTSEDLNGGKICQWFLEKGKGWIFQPVFYSVEKWDMQMI